MFGSRCRFASSRPKSGDGTFSVVMTPATACQKADALRSEAIRIYSEMGMPKHLERVQVLQRNAR